MSKKVDVTYARNYHILLAFWYIHCRDPLCIQVEHTISNFIYHKRKQIINTQWGPLRAL